jgi:hypothetical protein
MSLVLRIAKGSALTWAEADNNLVQLNNLIASSSIQSLYTKLEMDGLIASGSLNSGSFYQILVATGSFSNTIQEGGTTIILQAASNKTLSNKGVGLFWNPKYENPSVPTAPPDTNYCVWDYTNRFHTTNKSGYFDHEEYVYINSNVSSSSANLVANVGGGSLTLSPTVDLTFFSNPQNVTFSITGSNSGASAVIDYAYYTSSYNVGDKVIWGGKVWENLSGSLGYSYGNWMTEPLNLNPEDWVIVPYNTTDYDLVCDEIEYEYEYDNISYRKDSQGNEVKSNYNWFDSYGSGYNIIKYFPWGHKNVYNVSISNSYINNLLNFPNYQGDGSHNELSAITFEEGGAFNAHYWGRGTRIRNVSSAKGGHFRSLNLGYTTWIQSVTIGINGNITSIYTYDNDDEYTAIDTIEVKQDADIDYVRMWFGSQLRNIRLDDNAYFGDTINLYNYSSIRDVQLGNYSEMYSIDSHQGAEIRYITLSNNAYINSIYLTAQSNFGNITLANYSYIEYVWVHLQANFGNIEVGTYSYITCIVVHAYSYFANVKLGLNSNMAGITVGVNSNFSDVEVAGDSSINNIDVSNGSTFDNVYLGITSSISNIYTTGSNYQFQNVSLGSACNINDITFYNNSSIRNTDLLTDSSFGGIRLTENTSIHNFNLVNDSGFGGFTIYSGSILSNFDIQQGYGFCCEDFTASMSYVTIGRGFNNYKANVFSVTGSTNTSYVPVDYQNAGSTLDTSKSFHVIDISGQSATRSWYLPDGQYEGQEVTFLLKNDGTASITYNDIWIFLDNFRDSNGGLHTSQPWYPFNYITGFRNTGKAIWIDGAWNIDNGNYD